MKLDQTSNSNKYHVSRPKPFNGLPIADEDIQNVLDFAYNMCFGQGHHRANRTGGQYGRRAGEKFCNTFQGKLAEVALYNYFKSQNLNLETPDFRILGAGQWDDSDLEINGMKINVKSAASQSNLLLLETRDWDYSGRYLPNVLLDNGSTILYDYFILVRIDPDIKKLFKSKRLLYSDTINKSDIEEIISENSWSYDIAGYCTKQNIIEAIADGCVLPQNSILNHYTKIDAENYYVQSGDMYHISNLITELKIINI
ncbi:hypothetical protein [Chryseobacterium sp. KMC2]|uniref:hypothetical protein n=1 Tax=Chryseobacterium sp. KMC2 TaxID=2800705 RepID=UPI001923392E|nr:hypothetical protein [Chryseobacterium sp. KMC2]MBL3548833.1 hypothetical protein [Chryseobacterium sp. KMC2]